jgi:Flp pilus assembly protein TadD
MTKIFRPLTRALALAALAVLSCSPAVLAPALAMPSSIDEPPPAARNNDFNNAKTAIAKQDWSGAIALLQKVTAKEPKNPEAFNLLGYATRKSGDAKGSLQYYQTALQLDPKHLGANEYIGEAYLELGDVAKAEEHLKRLDELCTFNCKEYTELKNAIAAYKAGKKSS